MDNVLEALGGSEKGWQGWVSHEEHGPMKERLESVRGQFLEYLSKNDEERETWARAWPFRDR
jgi:hypothetical protein